MLLRQKCLSTLFKVLPASKICIQRSSSQWNSSDSLNEQRFILAYGFRGIHPWLAGSIALGPVWDWIPWWQDCLGRAAFALWQPKVERSNRKESGQDMPFQSIPALRWCNYSSLLQFNHLPIVYSDFEFINILNHSLGQELFDLVLSENASQVHPGKYHSSRWFSVQSNPD